MPKKPYEVLLIGAGNRGAEIYANGSAPIPICSKLQLLLNLSNPGESSCKSHAIPSSRQFTTWEEALSVGQLGNAAIICTQDQQHTMPAIKALESGYAVLLENRWHLGLQTV